MNKLPENLAIPVLLNSTKIGLVPETNNKQHPKIERGNYILWEAIYYRVYIAGENFRKIMSKKLKFEILA